MTRLCSALIFGLISFSVFCQNEAAEIQFRDVHLANVDHVLPDQEGKYFFTSDMNGKILMWEAKNFKVLKTIQKEFGSSVTGMTWIHNGQTLLVTVGAQGKYIQYGERMSYTYYTTGDKLMVFKPFSNDSTKILDGSTDILGFPTDSILMIGFGENTKGSILGLDKTDVSKQLFTIPAENIVSKAIINSANDLVVFTDFTIDYTTGAKDVYVLKLWSTKSNLQLFSKKYSDEKVVGMVFSPDESTLHILVFNKNN